MLGAHLAGSAGVPPAMSAQRNEVEYSPSARLQAGRLRSQRMRSQQMRSQQMRSQIQ